jgi:hypothetical protein
MYVIRFANLREFKSRDYLRTFKFDSILYFIQTKKKKQFIPVFNKTITYLYQDYAIFFSFSPSNSFRVQKNIKLIETKYDSCH